MKLLPSIVTEDVVLHPGVLERIAFVITGGVFVQVPREKRV
jgi:hypothetical protein